jgi:hypothetical protein
MHLEHAQVSLNAQRPLHAAAAAAAVVIRHSHERPAVAPAM